jgi:hypothetical protein
MMGWDWRLRTAASTGLLFILGWFAMWTMVWWYRLRLTPNLSTRALWKPEVLSDGPVRRHLWQLPVLAGGPVSRDISGSSQYCPVVLPSETSLERVGEWAMEMRICSIHPRWDLKRSFTCRKILRHWTSGFTSHPKEGVLRIFIALKNPSPWPGSNPQLLGPVTSTLTTTPPGRLRCMVLHSVGSSLLTFQSQS